LLANHYVHSLYPASEFGGGPVKVWRGEADLSVDPLTFGGHSIVATDLQTSNGYIHIVDGVVVSDNLRAHLQAATES